MNPTAWFTKFVAEKREWFAYRKRVKRLPEPYRGAAEAVQRYVLYTGPSDQAHWGDMLRDLVELFEQAAAAGTPVRDVVGADPVDFAEEFKRNYGVQSWLDKEQARLARRITEAETGGAR